MARQLGEITLDFDRLTSSDFDPANAEGRGWERLGDLCDEVLQLDDPARAAATLFRTMERLDSVDLGAPGPLVHTLERWPGRYEVLLAESVRRKPSPLSVWMVNRYLNARPPDADSWLALLRSVETHPKASAETRADAAAFLRYQADQPATG